MELSCEYVPKLHLALAGGVVSSYGENNVQLSYFFVGSKYTYAVYHISCGSIIMYNPI